MKRLSKEQSSQIVESVPLTHGRTAVLIDVAGRKNIPPAEYNKNVYCISSLGGVVWQIQAEGTIQERDSFVSLQKADDGSLVAKRFFGNVFSIDAASGVAVQTGWEK